ncbi:MAG: MliC family protein [Moraxella sp.]|nr:MliC family protein [Moraxella sp.]
MKKIALAFTAITLILTGCNSTNSAKSTTSFTPYSQNFLCDNGLSPVIRHINDSQATITLENTTTTLDIAVSASGERYVTNTGLFGHGGAWHQKGNMAVFDYKTMAGNPISTNCTAE